MTTLRPLLLDTRDGEWGKGEPAEGRVEMRVIRGTDFGAVREGQVKGVPVRYLEQRHADRKRLQPWDIVFETAGGSPDRPTGRSILLTPRTFELLGADITCASFARFLRVDPNAADPAFVFWMLQHHYETRDLLQYHTQHTGVARFQFTTFSNTFEFDLPPLETQQRIAAILGAYDDLIEVNRRRVAVLEEMARGLFEEWFVRFRFPGHEEVPILDTPEGPLPVGWEQKAFSELADFMNGFAFKPAHFEDEGLPIIKIPELRSGISAKTPRNSGDDVPDKYRVQIGDLLFSWSGTFAISEWTEGTGLLNQHLFLVRPATGVERGFLKQALRWAIPLFDNQGVGATMKHIRRSALDHTKVPYPLGSKVLEQSNEIFSSNYEQVCNLRRANQTLAASRDLLLPRLISGQLSVEDAESELEDAA